MRSEKLLHYPQRAIAQNPINLLLHLSHRHTRTPRDRTTVATPTCRNVTHTHTRALASRRDSTRVSYVCVRVPRP